MIALFTETYKKYTWNEYLELEKKSKIRHEFVRGKLIPMTGESKKANKIATNCLRMQADQLDDKGWEVFVHDIRLMVEDGALYRYPDLVIAQETDDKDSHAITQPVLIIEVLSDSTADKDRGPKLREYTQISTLHYYLLISQDEKLVEVYSRKDEQWILEFFDEPAAQIPIPFFNISLEMEKIYHKVKMG